MTIIRRFFLSLIGVLTVTALPLRSQNREVSGVVTDASTKETLIGATVSVEPGGTVVITDLQGNYSINAPSGSTLTFSCL